MDPLFEQLATQAGIPVWLFVVAVMWSLVWKAIVFWKSARNNHPIWFIVFFVIHTLGILEILYLFLFSKMNFPKTKKSLRKSLRKR